MNEMRVKLTFTEDILGTCSGDAELHERFIASKAPDALSRNEELTALIENEGVEDAVEKAMTHFPWENGKPFLWDYQIRGFFKGACKAEKSSFGSLSSGLTAYKTVIDEHVFVKERKVFFELSGAVTECQRPLRAETAQGPRVALANSESIPAGSSVEFTIAWDTPLKRGKPVDMRPIICEWLDRGRYTGIGQWRNSGKGRFEWQEVGA